MRCNNDLGDVMGHNADLSEVRGRNDDLGEAMDHNYESVQRGDMFRVKCFA